MKTFLLTTSVLFVITLPLVAISIVMINKIDAAYHRGYNDASTVNKLTTNIDKQCTNWLFEENLRDVKKRICK